MTYSIAIRTLGRAGVKYKRLLNSIDNLFHKPEKVIVILPEGYELPKERLGYEEFHFSSKGMVLQRVEALKYITSEYTLFCDDDIEFDSDFVDKLTTPLVSDDYDCSSGPLLSFFPPKSLKYLFASVLGGACVMLHGKKHMYVRILRTGGWSYNYINTNEHKIYDTESLAWTCFFIKTDVMKAIRFEDEASWLEKNGYAAFEDRVMFYKLKVNGYKTCVVSDAVYVHNDAKTSTRELKEVPTYCRVFNHFVFWHRFIQSTASTSLERILNRFAIEYYIILGGHILCGIKESMKLKEGQF